MIDHKFLSRTSRFYRPLRGLEEWIDRRSRVIFTSSTEARRILLQQFHCAEEQVRALPDCVEAATFKPAALHDQDALQRLRHTLGIPPEARIIVYLGLLAPYQGTDLLLEAMQRILQQQSNVYLLLMGFPGLDIYQHKADTLGISNHVRLTGRIPYQEAPLYLALGDVAVAPKLSLTESAGKLLNYMGVGIPTVAFDTPVAREYLGTAGLLARRGDPVDLAEALLKALGAPLLGAALRQRALDQFSWAKAGREIVAAYAELTAPQRVGAQIDQTVEDTHEIFADRAVSHIPRNAAAAVEQRLGMGQCADKSTTKTIGMKSRWQKWLRSKGMVIQE
jgi:glycosyltransferase involved in cell wall biosynthesis